MEEWKDIINYEGKYQISNYGNIKSLNYHRSGEEKLIKPLKRKDGYLKVILYKNGKTKNYFVHKLVALMFLENPCNYNYVNHKDEDKKNNCVDNLEFCSIQYNNTYKKYNRGKKNKSKINQFDLKGNLIYQWDSLKKIKELTNYSYYGIFNCLHNRQNTSNNFIWKYEVINNEC